MKTRVQRWGNGLAVRIPKAFAVEIGVENGTAIDITIVDGALLLTPMSDAIPALDELLASVTDENIHGEVCSGPSVGAEAW